MSLFDALAELEQFAAETAQEPAFYPHVATLTRLDGSTLNVRLRIDAQRVQRNFLTNPLELNIDRSPTSIGYWQPDIAPAVGERITLEQPESEAGQVYEVVEPITPDVLGFETGLSFVSGTR